MSEQGEVLSNVSVVICAIWAASPYHLLFHANTQFMLIAVDDVVLVQACLGQREVLDFGRYLRRRRFISAIVSRHIEANTVCTIPISITVD